MKGILAVLVVGLLGGGIAAVVVRKEAPETTITHTQPAPPPVTDIVVVPAAGQTLVTGTIQSFSADGAIQRIERGAPRYACTSQPNAPNATSE